MNKQCLGRCQPSPAFFQSHGRFLRPVAPLSTRAEKTMRPAMRLPLYSQRLVAPATRTLRFGPRDRLAVRLGPAPPRAPFGQSTRIRANSASLHALPSFGEQTSDGPAGTAVVVAALFGVWVGKQWNQPARLRSGRTGFVFHFQRQPASESDKSWREFVDYIGKNSGPVIAISLFIVGIIFTKFGDLDRRVSEIDRNVALGQQRTELQFEKFSERFDRLSDALDRIAEQGIKAEPPR